ncbi:hypothetical protein QOK75_26705 (plasmid) [Citrobacter freundii]|uniref:hypothetical protein n=1 Tax=Citrobacter freundii TaxID=546 RepID=UPI002543EE0C|nr:hypothetical protein [Citrobacter freundii]WIJ23335.1 hypothetical protein QOK75_26705 [Citrobacter freundii]WOQ06319.1 hypothetical protein R2X30_00300 [Citrobacter freundii]
MKHVKVLGTGCSGCKTTIRLIQQVADERGVAICLDSWDHVPMRSWPLFKARHVLRTLFQSDSSLATR